MPKILPVNRHLDRQTIGSDHCSLVNLHLWCGTDFQGPYIVFDSSTDQRNPLRVHINLVFYPFLRFELFRPVFLEHYPALLPLGKNSKFSSGSSKRFGFGHIHHWKKRCELGWCRFLIERVRFWMNLTFPDIERGPLLVYIAIYDRHGGNFHNPADLLWPKQTFCVPGNFWRRVGYLISSIGILCPTTNNSNETREVSTFFFVYFWIRMPSHNGR